MPALLPWLRTFLLPSICSIGATYAVLRWTSRAHITGQGGTEPRSVPLLSSEGKRVALGIAGAGVALILASALNLDLGILTCSAALIAVIANVGFRASKLREVTTGVGGACSRSSPDSLSLSRV